MGGYLKQYKVGKTAMLKEGIRKNSFALFAMFLLGCSNSNSDNKYNVSTNFINQNYQYYESERELLIDSIANYVDSSLKGFLGEYLWEWEVDSLICINNKQTRLVAAINISSGSCQKCVSDEIIKILGKKINNSWFFFSGGGTLIVPREYYGKSETNPLTFQELSQIARKERLASALIKNENGEYIINDTWVDDHFYNNGFGAFNNRAQYDSVHWYYILHKWTEKIDTNEYKPLRKDKVSS